MKSRTILLIALVFGLIAAYFTATQMNNPGDKSMVSVSSAKIVAGEKIQSAQLKLIEWPKASVPAGAFEKIEKLDGRVAKQDIQIDEPVLESMLAPIDSQAGLAAMIPLGKRAITVQVNEVVAVAGFALPGTFVDVLASVRQQNGEQVTKTVLQKVKILAVAQETTSDPKKPKVVSAVTLELTPKESQILDVARNAGSLSLSLRNEHDDNLDQTSATNLNDLLGNRGTSPAPANDSESTKKSATKPKEKAARAEPIEVIKGNTKAEVQF